MKATGIVRRIDDLGRVVIPKEIRRTMRIREGDPLEIYTTKEGEVIFKKYSLLGGLEDFAAQFCDTLSRSTDFTAAVTTVDAFLPFVDNWATCDQLSPKAFKGHFPALLPHIRRWMASPHPYTCRFGMGMLLRYGLDGDFDPAYLSEVAAPAVAEREEYYVRMMVAWFFATALAKQYEATLPYLTQHRLPRWIHNKTIQKACESYRVPKERKVVLRGLRWGDTEGTSSPI